MSELKVGATATLTLLVGNSPTTFFVTVESEQENGNLDCSFFSDGKKRNCVVPAYWLQTPPPETSTTYFQSFGHRK